MGRMKEYKLIYDRPAALWTETLPLGNGSLGAMVFGDPEHERIALNEDTLWSGYACDRNEPGRGAVFRRARDLVLQGEYARAQEVIEAEFMGEWTEGYLPLGDLRLHFPGEGAAAAYRRELSLNNGVHRTQYERGGAHILQECFVSAPDGVLVLKIECGRPIDFTVTLTSPMRHALSCEGGELLMTGRCPSHVEPSYVDCPQHVFYSDKEEEQGLSFCAAVTEIGRAHV